MQVNYVYSHALDEISNGGFNGFSGNSIPFYSEFKQLRTQQGGINSF